MIFRESVENKKPYKQAEDEFFADFNMYSQMAHYVGKVLHIRPNEILDTWGVPELIVAYGEYANEVSQQNYEDWKHMDAKDRGEKPERFIVKFYGADKIEE